MDCLQHFATRFTLKIKCTLFVVLAFVGAFTEKMVFSCGFLEQCNMVLVFKKYSHVFCSLIFSVFFFKVDILFDITFVVPCFKNKLNIHRTRSGISYGGFITKESIPRVVVWLNRRGVLNLLQCIQDVAYSSILVCNLHVFNQHHQSSGT